MKLINAIVTIAFRDFIKLLRDYRRLVASLVFPVVFIGIFGNSLDSNLGNTVAYSFIAFTFTGVLGQILFQSSASGIISLIIDREEDFAQELFIAPVSRYVIIVGKIIGEALVSMVQGIGVILFGLIIGVEIGLIQMLSFIPIFIVNTLLGGAFGTLIMANLDDQKSVNLIFPFLLLPQFFLAGVFSPINNLPLPLFILSRIAPMTYVVDFTRHMFFINRPELSSIVINPLWVDLSVIFLMFVVFLTIGTFVFIKKEKSK